MLMAAASTARERGAAAVSVADVVARAGVSRRTFYEIFADRDECLRAVFDEALARAAAAVVPAWQCGGRWREAVKAALHAFLAFLDEEPTLGAFLVIDSLGAGDWALARRAAVVDVLVDAVDGGRALARSRTGASHVIAEGVVGGALSIVHGRLLDGVANGARDAAPASMTGMLGELVEIVLLPYLGSATATREARSTPPSLPPVATVGQSGGLRDLEIRITYRTAMALKAIAELGAQEPGPSNREVGAHAGIVDPGQVSKLLARLARAGLAENLGGGEHGEPNAWRLTAKGAQVEQTTTSGLER
jgi:AcrR family transcriptional regulator